MTLVHSTAAPTCPRCTRLTLDASKIILSVEEAADLLAALGSLRIRTKSTLYSAISRGTAPRIYSREGGRVRFSHCDLCDHHEPLTLIERRHIELYDAREQAKEDYEVKTSIAELEQDVSWYRESADDIRTYLDPEDPFDEADEPTVEEARARLARLEEHFADAKRAIVRARRDVSAFIREKELEQLNADMGDDDVRRNLVAIQQFQKNRREVHS